MREQKNIIYYGFFIFLIVLGISTFFYNNDFIVNNINCLSIPVLSFSIALLLSKSNQIIRNEVLKEINLHEAKSSLGEKTEDYKLQLTETEIYKIYVKKFCKVDTFTRIINSFATISLVWCLLSLIGIFRIEINSHFVNAFSLALIFFDFYILDDLIIKAINKINIKLSKQAEINVKRQISGVEDKT